MKRVIIGVKRMIIKFYFVRIDLLFNCANCLIKRNRAITEKARKLLDSMQED